VKFSDFEIMSRSRSVALIVGSRDDHANIAVGLLEKCDPATEGGAAARCFTIVASIGRRGSSATRSADVSCRSMAQATYTPTAEMDRKSFAWPDGLRSALSPDRNVLSAHLKMASADAGL
jgi:hypothetical protein